MKCAVTKANGENEKFNRALTVLDKPSFKGLLSAGQHSAHISQCIVGRCAAILFGSFALDANE